MNAVSHSWQLKFLEVVDALVEFAASQPAGLDTVAWMDVFCHCQHTKLVPSFDFLTTRFVGLVGDIGHVVTVLLPWNKPVVLTRTWCVFEVYACMATGGRFDVAMPAAERSRFLEGMLEDSGVYYKALSEISSRKSDCFDPSDRVQLFDAIERSVGFTQLDSTVLRAMEGWLTGSLEEQIRECAQEPLQEAKFQGALGMLLMYMGQDDKALPLQEILLGGAEASSGRGAP